MALTRPTAAQINFDVTNITDPLITLNSGESGSADKDTGIVLERGSDTNVAIIYDESADTFAVINTSEDGTTSGNVSISSYAPVKLSNLIIADAGNIGSASDTDAIAISSGGVVTMNQIPVFSAGINVSGGSIAGTLSTAAQTNITSLGTLTALTVDDITINGSTISDAADLTVDVGGDIILDAGGGDIIFKDGGTTIGTFANNSNNLRIVSNVSDADLILRGVDGGAAINALTLDMSEAGAATFNGAITGGGLLTTGGNIVIPDDGNIGSASDTDAIAISSGGVVTFSQTPVFSSDITVTDDIYLDSDGSVIHFGDDGEVTLTHVHNQGLRMEDSDKLTFGAGDDLQLYHDGSNSYIDDGGDGSIFIRSGTTYIQNAAGSKTSIATNAGAGQDIYHNNTVKLTTTANGITVSGGIIIADAGTIGSASDTDAISISSGGVVNISATTTNTSTTTGALTVAGGAAIAENLTVGEKLRLKSDGAQLFFGASGELKFIHVADTGLTLTHSGGTGDNLPIVFQLKSEEDAIIADEVIASLEFAAGDSDGTDGATVAAGIHAIAEGAFSASANATKLVFTTGVSETAAASATAKMTLSSAGLLTIADDFVIKDGGTIGSASDTDAIAIASNGVVTFTQAPVFPDGSIAIADLDIDGGTDIGEALADADLLIVDNGAGGTNRKVAMSRVKTYVGGGALDDISAGDSASTLATTAGNITIDAQGSDTDIIFKGTDGASDTTFLTIDGSAAGKATFNNEIVSGAVITSGAGLVIADAGNIGSASDTNAIAISAAGLVTLSATASLSVTGTSTFNEDVTFTGAAANVVWDKSVDDLIFADNAKAAFGTSSDLTIYHDGSNSIIEDVGTGVLAIRGSAVHIQNAAGSESLMVGTQDGAVTLYHDNSAKLATASGGGTLTGTWNVTTALVPDASDGAALGTTSLEWSDLYLADGSTIQFGADQDITLTHVADKGLIIAEGDAGTWAAPANFDTLVVESGSNGGIVLGVPDADEGVIGISSPTKNGAIGFGLLFDYDAGIGRVFTSKVGASTRLEADNQITNLTLAGASGSETATFAGDVVIADAGTIGSASDTDAIAISSGGDVTLTQNLILNAQGDIRFADNDSSNYVAFQAPNTISSNVTWTLPAADGDEDQVLSTNGSGTLAWADAGSGGSSSASSYPNSTVSTMPGSAGNYDLAEGTDQDGDETPFEAGGTDAFGVNMGTVYSMMDPAGSTTTVDLGSVA